jgi:hypothetical protein
MVNTDVISSLLTSRGEVINFKSQSIFAAMSIYGNKEEDYATIANAIANAVTNELILIKTKLLPLTESFTNLAKEKAAMGMSNSFAKYNIVDKRIPEYIKILKDENIIKKFRTPIMLPITALSFQIPAEPIKNILVDKDGFRNNSLQAIVGKYTEQQLIELWNKYLSNVSSSNTYISNLSTETSNDISDVAILYVIGTYLKDNKPNEINVSDSTYTDIMFSFTSEMLNYMGMGLYVYENYKSLGKLILRATDPFTLFVHGELYDMFLENGGTPDTLLGMLTSVDDFNTDVSILSNIEMNKDVYNKAWENKNKLDTIQASLANGSKYRIVYSLALRELFTSIPADLKEVVTVSFADADKLLSKYLERFNISDIINVDLICKEIVGLILVPETNFQKFTNYMMEYSKLNPSITAQEAASIASADMIVDYLLQQVTINGLTRG